MGDIYIHSKVYFEGEGINILKSVAKLIGETSQEEREEMRLSKKESDDCNKFYDEVKKLGDYNGG